MDSIDLITEESKQALETEEENALDTMLKAPETKDDIQRQMAVLKKIIDENITTHIMVR